MEEHCIKETDNTTLNVLSENAKGNRKGIMQKILQKFGTIPKEEIFIFFAISVTLLGDSSIYVLLPIYATDLGIPLAAVGIILSMNRFIRLITNYYAKSWLSYFGGRRLFTFSVVVSAITTLFYGLPVGVIVLILSRAVWGACWSSMRLVGFVSIAENSTDSNRGTLTGLFHSTVRIGSLFAIFLGGILSDSLGYRNTFYIFALLTFIIGMPLSYYGMWKQKDHSLIDEIEPSDTEEQDPGTIEAVETIETTTNIDESVSLKSIYVMTFLNAWVGNGLLLSTIGYIMLLKFGKEVTIVNMSIGISIAASFLVSVKWFYDIFLSVFFGKLSDRFGRSRIIIINCILQIISLLMIAYTQSFISIFIAAIIGFAGVTALTSTLDATAIGFQAAREDKNILGIFTTWQDLGAALGAMAGYSLTISIGYSKTYLLTSIMIALAVAFSIKDSNYKKKKGMYI